MLEQNNPLSLLARSVRGDLRGVVEGGIEHLRGVSGVADRTHVDSHSYSAEGVEVNFSNISALWDTFTHGKLFARGFQPKKDSGDSDLGKSVSSLDNRVIGLRWLCVVWLSNALNGWPKHILEQNMTLNPSYWHSFDILDKGNSLYAIIVQVYFYFF